MALLDRAKSTAGKARTQASHGLEAGRGRLGELQSHHRYGRLLRQLGVASYDEYRGIGTRARVAEAFEELDMLTAAHPEVMHGDMPTVHSARDIMHVGAECVGVDDTLQSAAEKMRDLGVGSLPICGHDDRLHGILTDRDITIRCVAEGRDPLTTRCAELAQSDVYWVAAGAELVEVVDVMEDHQVKRLPVIDNHRLVGVISEADLARHLSEHQLAEFVERVYATG